MDPYFSIRHDSHRVSAPELDRDLSQENSKSGRLSKDSSQERLQKDSTPLLPRDRSISKLGSQSDLDVSIDMFQKLSQSMQRQNMGPSQLKQSLDEILKQIHVEQWKNIPLPVCIATTALMTCVNDLKRFSLYMENRFSNLTASTNQSIIDMFNLADKLKTETEQTLTYAEQRLSEKIISTNEELDAKIMQRLAELKAESAVWAADKITQEINVLKPWIGKVVDDKIFASERKQTAEFTKKIKETKDMFCVPELIGPVGCPFQNFQAFAQKAHENLKQLDQEQQQITGNLHLYADEQRQTAITIEESIRAQSTKLEELVLENGTQLNSTIKLLERQQERGFSELSDKLREQDVGQDIRVKTKLICNEWNEKIMEIGVLAQNGQQLQKRIDQLRDCFERIESQVAYQNTENEKIVFDLRQQLEKQEQNAKEVMNIVSQSPKGLLQRKTTIKSSVKQTEPTFTKESKRDNNESGTILKSSEKSSINDQEKNEYKTKPKSLRKSSANKSSQSRLSGHSESKISQGSLKKSSKKEQSLPFRSSSVSQNIQSRVLSAQPMRPTFASIKQQQSLEQVNYDQEINITRNHVEIEDLTDRLRQVELQLIKLQRFQTNLQQKQARERKKQVYPIKPTVDRTLAGILELGKFQLGQIQKSASNSPENKQQNAQLNIQQRGPLQWEAEKKRWIKEPMFAPDLNMKINNLSSEVMNSRSRSREHNSKNISQLRDRISYGQQNFDTGDRSQDLYSAESNAYVQSKVDLRNSKGFTASLLLNNPSNNGFGSDSNFDKKPIVSKELDIQSDELRKNLQSVNQTQIEKQILQSHAQIYYMKDGIRPDTKKRPLTGVRAQDLTNSANNLQLKISDMEKSPRRNVILPQLREPHKLISSKQQSSKLFKLSSAQV